MYMYGQTHATTKDNRSNPLLRTNDKYNAKTNAKKWIVPYVGPIGMNTPSELILYILSTFIILSDSSIKEKNWKKKC